MSSSPTFSTQKAVRPILLPSNAGPRAASAVRRGSNILGSPSLFHRNHEENFDDDTLTSGGGPFRPVAPLLGVALTGPVEVDAFSHYVREAEALASSSSHSLLGDHHLLAPPRGGDRNEAARAVQAAMLGGKGKGNSSASVILNGGGMNTGGGGGGVQMMTRKPNSNSTATASSSSVKQQPYPSTASLLSAFRERLSRINSEEEDDVATSDTYEARAFLNQQHQQQRRRASMDNHHPPQPPLPLSSSLSVSSFNQFSKYSSLQALGIDPVLEGLQQQQRDHRRTNSSSPPRLLGGNLPSSSTLNHSNQYLLSVGGGGGAPSSSSPSSYSKLDVDELRRAAKQVSQDALKSVADDVLTGKAFESAEAAVQAAFGDEEQQKEDRFNNIYNSKTNSYGGGGDILRSVSPKARRQSIQQQEASKAILDQFIQPSSSHSPQREVFEASALLSSPMPQHHNPPRLSSMPALPQSFNNNNNNSSSSHPNPRQNTASSSRLYQETAASARKKDNLYKDDEKITFRTYKPPHPPSSSTSRPVAMRQRRSSIGSIPVSKLNSNGPPHPHPAQTQHRANAIAKSTTNLNPSSRMGGGVQQQQQQQQQQVRTRRGSLDSSSLSILAPPKKTLDRLFRNDDPRYSSLYPPTIANSIQRQKEQQLLRQLNNKNDLSSSSSQSRAVAHANAQQRTHRIGRPAATAAAAAPVIMRRGDNSNTLLSNPIPEQPPPTLESYEREQVAKWKQAAADVDGPLPPPHLFPLPPGSEGKAVKSLEFLRSLLTTDSYPSNPQAATTSTSRFSPRATTNGGGGGGLKKSKYQTADQAASAAQSAAAAVSASAASAITSTGGILGLLERMALSEEQLSIYRSKSSQLEGILKRLTSQLSHREALEKRLTNNDTSNPTGGFDVNGRRDLLSSLSSSYNTSHLSPATSALLNASSGGVGGVNIHPSSSVLSSSNHSSSNNADEFTSTYGLTGQMGVGLNADIDHAMSRLYSKLQMELVGDASADINSSSSSSSAPPPPPSSSFRVSDANFDLLYPSSSSSSSSSSASPSSALEKSEEVRGMISKRLEKVHNALTSPNSNIVKRSTDHYMPTGTDGDATSTSLSSPTGANFNSGSGSGSGGGVLSRLLTGTSLASAIEVAESHSQSMKKRLALAAMTSPPHNQLQQLLANNRQSSSSSFAPSTPPAPPSLFSSVTSAAASTAPSIPSVTTSSLLEQHRQHKEAILSSIKILSNPILIPDASSSSSLPSYLQENTGGTRSSRLALLEGAVANAAKQSQEQQLKSAAARQPSSSLLKTDTLLPKWAISNSNSSSSSSSSSSTLNISVPVKSDVASSSSSSPVKKLSSSDEGGGGGGGGVLNEAVAVAKAVAEAINKRKNEEKKETSFNDSTLTYASSYSKKPPSTVSASTSSSSSSGAPPLTTTTLKASRVLESFDLLHRMFDDALIPGPDSVSLSLSTFESNNNNTKRDGGGGEGTEGNSRTNSSPKSAPPTRDAPLPPASSSSDTVEVPSRE